MKSLANPIKITEQLKTFNLAKGILVVDPIEARGVKAVRSQTTPEVIYLLFQIGTRVLRSQPIATSATVHKWREDSQSRFEINPGVRPILTVYLIQYEKPVPIVLGKGESSLIDVFYESKVDKWVELNTGGQINIEFTFYAIAPLVPMKLQDFRTIQQEEGEETLAIKTIEGNGSTKKLMTAFDIVFDDNHVEQSLLKKLAMKVRRRYRESIKDSYEYQDGNHARKSSINSLKLAVSGDKKKLPPVPSNSHTELLLSENSADLIQSPNIEFEELSIRDLNIESLPFSADDIGGDNFRSQMNKLRHKEIQERLKKNDYQSLSPEEYFFIDRLQKGILQPGDFFLEAGVSEYKGDGEWNKGCLRDSIRIQGPAPRLPPKIPIGMKEEEYFVTNRHDCIEYFRKAQHPLI